VQSYLPPVVPLSPRNRPPPLVVARSYPLFVEDLVIGCTANFIQFVLEVLS
jgi:hypothetical protein